MSKVGIISAALCLAVILLASQLVLIPVSSPDLSATVFAGHFWNIGQSDQIYNLSEDGLFRMLPPVAWQEWLTSRDYAGPIYPFVYPPLWVVVGALMDRIATPLEVSQVAYMVNPILYWATLLLALRTSVSPKDIPRLLLLSVLLSYPTWTIIVALAANQPQILVSFLIVLAIERSRSASPVLAGFALALAASLKLYPALFAVVWLGQRQYRALASFLICGGILAALSVSLTGWSLHLTYLDLVREISATFVASPNAVSLDNLFGTRVFDDGQFEPVSPALASGLKEEGAWYIAAKPTAYRIVAACLLVLVVAGLGLLARRHRVDQILVWTLAVTVISLLSPLSWSYSYIATLAFLPALIQRFPAWQFVVLAGLVLVPINILQGIALPPWVPNITHSAIGLSLFSIALAFSILRSRAPATPRADG